MTRSITLLAVGLACLCARMLATEPLLLTTQAALELAMERHEALRIARSEATSAQAEVRAARADGLVDVSSRFDYTRNWLLPSILFNDAAVKIGSDNEMLGMLSLRQPLYTGGLVGGALQASRSRVVMAGEGERLIRQSISAAVETALYDYLLATEIARVRHLAVERARTNQQQVGAMRDAGKATRFDWARVQVQVAAAVADSIEADHDVALVALNVRDAIGVDMAQEIVIQATFRDSSALLPSVGSSAEVLDSLVSGALSQRPERRQALALASSHQGDEAVARAGTRPRLDLLAVGQMQFQDDAFNGASDADEWRRSWSTGVSLEVPLFEGMRSRARVAQAREARRRVELQVVQLDRTIEAEVRRAWMDVSAAGQRLLAYRGTVGQAQIGVEDASSRYRVGVGTQLEVLDAQLTLLQSESDVARARRDRAIALVALELATGTLGEVGN